MPKPAKEMQPLQVGRAEPGFHAVGVVPGLYLLVWETGARSWILRVKVGGKRREMGLGGYPAVTLAQAREKARQKRDQISEGVDPIEHRRAERSALVAAQVTALTFEQAALAYIKVHEGTWKNAKHQQQWRNTLEQYAFPIIGKVPVSAVTKEQVLQVLQPIWSSRNETASRLRGRIEAILTYAMQSGARPEGLNPARLEAFESLLPARKKVRKIVNHPAMAVGDVGAFMAGLRGIDTMGARALEFLILTAARSGEARGATWAEIDFEERVWTVPADRIKAGVEHRVPLPEVAVELLKNLPRGAAGDYVFASPRGGSLSDMTLTAIMRRQGLEAVPHGFRSTFRDWAAERTSFPRELAEKALAHSLESKVEAAYQRGDLLEKRRVMMEAWAKFLAKPEVKGSVVHMKARAKKA